MKKYIDGRSLSCPQPVIKVKQAFDEGDFKELEVIVDNKAAVENVTRFVENSENKIISVKESESIFTILIENVHYDGKKEKPETPIKIVNYQAPAPTSIFINSSTIGSGDNKLGEKLMEAFLYSLTEVDKRPEHILIMNSGVKVTVEGSPSLDNLKELEESGVKILVCGACLDYYEIQDKLKVGKISNMYEITSALMGRGNTVTVG